MNRKIIFTCRLNETERDTLKRYAIATNAEASAIVRIALNEYIQRHPVTEKPSAWSYAKR